jgi:hypothetical protein
VAVGRLGGDPLHNDRGARGRFENACGGDFDVDGHRWCDISLRCGQVFVVGLRWREALLGRAVRLICVDEYFALRRENGTFKKFYQEKFEKKLLKVSNFQDSKIRNQQLEEKKKIIEPKTRNPKLSTDGGMEKLYTGITKSYHNSGYMHPIGSSRVSIDRTQRDFIYGILWSNYKFVFADFVGFQSQKGRKMQHFF